MLIFLGLQSCKSTYQITADSYSKNDTLFVKDYLFQVRDNKVVNAPDEIGDSLFTFFKGHLLSFDLPIKIIEGGENKVDYFFLKEGYSPWPFKSIKTSLLLEKFKTLQKNQIVLVPFIEVFNRSVGSAGGYTYSSIANIELIFLQNDKIIYRYQYRISTDVHFEPEHKKIKRNMNTKEDWEKAINGAMKEYIERLE